MGGGLGSIHVDRRGPFRMRTKGSVVGFFALALFLVGVMAFGIVSVAHTSGVAGAALVIALPLYCALGYFVQFRANHNNIGLLNGLINHPFRVSDDVNRMLIMLELCVLPGRLVAVGIRDYLRYASDRTFPQAEWFEP